ncbi:alpha/beta hydrolase [Candidatus Woesearchaeota archaeon]|nr:alpha/beta hydrolase [Candidatus Woesearchaeota archaeon]
MKKRIAWLWKEHRKIAVALIIAVIILLSVFGTQIYLYINFLLGNNVVVKLDVSPQLLKVTRGESAPLEVKASVNTNPFCSAACSLKVMNLAEGTLLLEEGATLRPGLNMERTIPIVAPEKGHGTMPLEVQLDCQGVETFLCHTDEKLTTRNLLVMVKYNLSAEEEMKKAELTGTWQMYETSLSEIEQRISSQEGEVKQINVFLETEQLVALLTSSKEKYLVILEQLKVFEELWNNEDYEKLKMFVDAWSFAEQTEPILEETAQISSQLEIYNESVRKMEQSGAVLAELSDVLLADKDLITEIQTKVKDYNLGVLSFNNRTALVLKQGIAETFSAEINLLHTKVMTQRDTDALARAIKVKIIAAIFCQEKGECLPTVSMIDLATEAPANLSAACSSVQVLQEMVALVKPELEQEAAAQNYPTTVEFADTIKVLAENAQQEQMNLLGEQIPPKAAYTQQLQTLLPFKRPAKTTSFPQYDLTPAVLLEVLESMPQGCTPTKAGISVLPLTVQKIVKQEQTAELPVLLSVLFNEPPAQCCLDGKCKACCTENICRDNSSYYPIVFLHGHAFNKDTSYEYSLDAFNGIQQYLEQDGYINAGAVSLYTKKDLPSGEFGLFNAPMTIKVSYYVDLFQTPENYVVVQTKSENIDVYALRLKEILDTVKYQTGRPKVIIVAHSMGGLVARRYMQIFGAGNVAKLVTIGTPHQGIEGDVADYCDLIGEQRECGDMNKESIFMNKLKNGILPPIPVTTIIGTGCDMNGEEGDGVVLERNAELEGAGKMVVQGKCSTLSTLHTEMLDVDLYPEVYEAIKEEIKVD